MRIQTSQKAELFARALRATVLGVFAVFVCAFLFSSISPSQTSAAASSNINFQSKLETASGAIVPDGSYNVEFKLYNASSSSGSSQGSCTGDPDCLWVEDYLNSASQGVQVVNGYLTVSLGSITSFPATINWSQQLWLTMNIGGVGGSPTWNGEMNPRLLLTATPYSFQSGELSTTNSSYVGTLSFASTLTGTDSITIPDTGGAGGTVCLQGTSGCGFLTGSGAGVQLQSGSPPGTPQTGNFNVSGTGIAGVLQGSTSVLTPLLDTPTAVVLNIGAISSPEATSINLNQNTVIANNKSITANGSVTFEDATTSPTAFQVLQTATGPSALTVDTTNLRVDVGTNGTPLGQLYVSGSVPSAAIGSYSIGSGSDPYDIDVQGNYAYVVNENVNTLAIYDISNPANPASVGSVTIPGSSPKPYSVYVSGKYAYVAAENTSLLYVYDISNPEIPTEVGSIATGSNPFSVYVSGHYAYVANEGSSTLGIYDISNPAIPTSVGSIATGTHPYSVYVQGRYAYVANEGSSTLGIYDISNPAIPTSVGSIATGTNPYSVYVAGSYAYVANYNASSLTIYDISNPAIPTSIGSLSTGGTGNSRSVYVSGRYAYVVNKSLSTLQIIDISNPSSPSSVGTVSTGSAPYAVYIQGRYAYVANEGSGTLQVFDLGGSYIQQLQAGSTETGSLQVDNNAQVNGDQSIAGGLTVGQSTELSGDLGVSGSATFSDQANSTTAFQVQNAAGATVLATDTTSNTVNLSGNLNFTQVAAPTTAPTVAVGSAGSLSGTYYYVVTYVTASGQTNYGPVSALVSPSSQEVNLTVVPVSPSNLVTARDIYRGTSSTGPFDLVGSIANNTATTYTDNNTSPGSAASDINQTTNFDINGSPVLIADSASQNTALGVDALQGSTSGDGTGNTALGYQSMYEAGGGQYDVAIGYENIDGYDTGGLGGSSYDVAIGANNLNYGSSGNNVAIGNGDLSSTGGGSGSDNIAIGQYVGSGAFGGLPGDNNIGIGFIALGSGGAGSGDVAIGYGTLQNNDGGSNNVAIGYNTFTDNVGGSNNVAIGYNAGNSDSSGKFTTTAALQNATTIGAYAQVQASNSIVLGSVDTPTNVGIGTTIPLNTFSVSPMVYNAGTACSTATSGGTSCSGTSTVYLYGTGTTWTSSMVGDQLIFANGQSSLISAVTSATAITLSTAVNKASGSYYRIQVLGFNVTSSGTAFVQNNSTTAFQVQNAAGNQTFGVNTSASQVLFGQASTVNASLVAYNSTNSNTVTIQSGVTSGSYSLTLPTGVATTGQCLEAGTVSGSTVPLTWGSCGGSGGHSKEIVLTPEYAGAVLDNGGAGNDVGTMTSGFDSTQRESYYQWTTTQATNQVYDVVVQLPVPSDFSSWASTTPITVDVKTSNTTNGTVTAKLIDTTGTTEGSWNTCSLTPGTTSWTTVTGCTVAGTYAANGVITLRLILQAPTSGTTEIGNIKLSYNSAY
ncbi:MAG: hypothetical protein ACREF5_02315 [Candidatus Saccharimonadales bacterium]